MAPQPPPSTSPETKGAEPPDIVADPESGPSSIRRLRGPYARAFTVLAVAIAGWHIYTNNFIVISDLIRNSLHLAMFGTVCLILYPLVRPGGRPNHRGVIAIDATLVGILIASVIYLLWNEVPLAERGYDFNFWDYATCFAVIAITLELVRRLTGWFIPLLILTALTYVVWWGQYMPGTMRFPGLSMEVTLLRSVYGEDGMFGMIARISATFVFMFILFGAFLVRSGAGDFIIDLARAMAGRLVGGPGFVAVIGSGLTGTISGSAVANTVSTGVITIPLMKRSGFPAKFAAGVEASASTGGQLMPPIMGAGAFVMANTTQIPYLDIVAVAFLPAVLYFLGVGFYVRIEAKKQGLKADEEGAESVWSILKRNGVAFFLPLAVLIGMLMAEFTPSYAAGFAIAAVIVASWLTPNKMGPKAILEALELGVRNMVLTAVLLVAVGLIVGAIATTGVGNTFSLMISDWAGGSLFIAIVLIAIASLILGMGLPVTASYIVLATLSAPALQQLILNAELIDQFMAGTIAQEAQAILMLVAPDQIAALGQPMDAGTARALVDMIPPEMAPVVRDAMVAPAMITTALLSAHMIVYWLSQDSNITPPVCLTAFAAAAIAGTKPMATGFMAWKVAKSLYIIPLLFAYTPFLAGDPVVALEIFFFGCFGLYAIIAAIEGHAEAPYPFYLRPILAGIGVALMWPNDLPINLAGAVLLVGFMVWNVRRDRTRAAETAAA